MAEQLTGKVALGTPEEVAALIIFLASDSAACITGAAVDIHGGELII